jgi:hypothetical protein
MSRPALERWLVAHFLKLALPFPRAVAGDELVYAPLNMTTFFRLVGHVADLGYPAHWLSALLSSLCKGEITTTARAPRAVIMGSGSVGAMHKPRVMCFGPFAVEFAVLLSVWRHLLPFSLQLSGATLPYLSAVRQYHVSFSRQQVRMATAMGVPHFALFLGRPGLLDHQNLRDLLLDDELGDNSQTAATLRRAEPPSVHVVSVFSWNAKTATADSWFDEAVMAGMQSEGDWVAYIWRTDTWHVGLGPVPLKDGGVTAGMSWC